MEICVCVKRVPVPGGRVPLTADARAIDTRALGFTISPHEECAVEEAVRLVERLGGSTTVVTLGPAAAEAQLRDAMALGPERAVLLETDGEEWDPGATAKALVDAIRDAEAETGRFDLILLGQEAADSADYQVPVRVGHLLGRPVATGINSLAVDATTADDAGTAAAGRAVPDGWDRLHVPLPAVLSVREGLNLPRYP
ncbi:MAG: electron transfer flavoprotein subunit beta/FixA family protein, partial [Acidimicrobiales bacterium]